MLDALEEASSALEDPETNVPTTIDDVLPAISEGDEFLIEANN